MVGRFILGMAGLAIRRPSDCVVEFRVLPTAGVVAARTLTAKVVGRLILGVARLAICRSGRLVVEGCVFPSAGVVAARTLTAEVVGGLILGVGLDDSLLEVANPSRGSVLGEVLGQRLDGGLLDILRRGEIGLPGAKTNDIDPVQLHLCRLGRHGHGGRNRDAGDPFRELHMI